VEQGTRIVFDHVSDRVRRVRVLRFNDVNRELADLRLVALGHFEERLLVDLPSSVHRFSSRDRERVVGATKSASVFARSAPVRDRGRDPYARGSPAPRPPVDVVGVERGPGSSDRARRVAGPDVRGRSR